jgi:predicted acyl esterase
MIPWEGAADFYRDSNHHGGIPCRNWARWYPAQVFNVQYGVGSRAPVNPNTGDSVAGPVDLSEEELAHNRLDLAAEILRHPLDDQWYRDRSADWSKVEVPFLSVANWGGQGLHPRGNFEAFTQAASREKWLEVHGDTHWTGFYADAGIALQKRFLDYYLKGSQNGWDREARVLLNIRHPGERFEPRREQEWPLARTRWTKLWLRADGLRLGDLPAEKQETVTYDGLGDGVTFSTPPLQAPLEITGPVASKLFVSSSTTDADLFLVLRVFDPEGEEVVFQGSNDPSTPIGLGWLRASHRKLDLAQSLPYRPYHTHDELQPLTPGAVYELDVEIWPTCIVVPPGYRVGLTVRGKDYRYGGKTVKFSAPYHQPSTGVGPYTHADPNDRPPEIFGGKVTLHLGGARESYLLLPVIPS